MMMMMMMILIIIIYFAQSQQYKTTTLNRDNRAGQWGNIGVALITAHLVHLCSLYLRCTSFSNAMNECLLKYEVLCTYIIFNLNGFGDIWRICDLCLSLTQCSFVLGADFAAKLFLLLKLEWCIIHAQEICTRNLLKTSCKSPTRNPHNSAFHPFGVGKWVAISIW